MGYLYLLSESDHDDLLYHDCVGRITGKSLKILEGGRLRKGGGIKDVRRNIRHLLNLIKNTGSLQDTYFVIALDNDRSPTHPEHSTLPDLSQKERKKSCRFCEIEKLTLEILGEDRSQWPIPGAIAVPAQMLESWLLLMGKSEKYGEESSLPLFAEKESGITQAYYSSKSKKIPLQLKDLCRQEKEEVNLNSMEEWISYCVGKLEVEELKERSGSFSQFAEQVEEW